MDLGAKISQYINDNRISQKILAQKASMTETAMSLALGGKRKLTAEEYINICNALCLPYDKFTEDLKIS